METRKIAVACFIGGVLCASVALYFTPAFWWLGLFAGAAGGYFSYEFRNVLRAIPVALRDARRGGAKVLSWLTVNAKSWFSKPHPFLYPAALITLPGWLWCIYHLIPLLLREVLASHGVVEASFIGTLTFVMAILLLIELSVVMIAPIALLALIGARFGERCYWWPFIVSHSNEQMEQIVARLEGEGLRRVPTSYSNVLRWILKGVCIIMLFFVWTLWKYLAISLWIALCFMGRFSWHLFRLIHSEKRVLCALDGTLGGALAYLMLVTRVMSSGEQILLTVFGGLLGAAFGVLNWEIVSKRWLKVAPVHRS